MRDETVPGCLVLLHTIEVNKDVHAGDLVKFEAADGNEYYVEADKTGKATYIGAYRTESGSVVHKPWIQPAWRVHLCQIVKLIEDAVNPGRECTDGDILVDLEAIAYHAEAAVRRFQKRHKGS